MMLSVTTTCKRIGRRRNVLAVSSSSSSSSAVWKRRQSPRWMATTATTTTTTSTTSTTTDSTRPSNYNHINNNTNNASLRMTAIALASLSIGFTAGRLYQPPQKNNNNNHHQSQDLVLPNGLPRTCCDENNNIYNHLTNVQKALPSQLKRIVGTDHVLDGTKLDTRNAQYLKGARLGSGHALCIVTPERLQDVVDCVEQIVQADCVVLVQGQNTGLTGGSVPHTNTNAAADTTTTTTRPVVIISTKHLNRIFPLDDGKRICCLAGAGLGQVEQFLQTYFPDRESHSVLGSTFLNPTVSAGVAFGSGGTQCRKGPAYTERALYLKINTNKWQEKVVEIVNTLAIDGIKEKEMAPGRARKMDSMAYKLDTWSRWIADDFVRDMKYTDEDDPSSTLPASDVTYAEKLCECDSPNVSRYNADTRGPDCCRSEGKVIILATVHDTFPKPKQTKTYWIGFDSLETALEFRKTVALNNPNDLPVSMEYMDRDSMDVIDRSGRILANVIKWTGTSSPLVRKLWNVKLYVEALPFAGASTAVDQLLHTFNPIVPSILPTPIQNIGKECDHHVAMTIGDFGSENDKDNDSTTTTMERIQKRMEEFVKQHPDKVKVYECTSPREAASIDAFRFVAAPAFRTWCVGEKSQGFSVDYALPKNGGMAPPLVDNKEEADSTTTTTTTLSNNNNNNNNKPIKRMRYSHFACNVVHEDLAFDTTANVQQVKQKLKQTIEHDCGGKLPAEHGHGTEYVAPPETQARWKRMDPLNVFNPGVGGLSEKFRYQE